MLLTADPFGQPCATCTFYYLSNDNLEETKHLDVESHWDTTRNMTILKAKRMTGKTASVFNILSLVLCESWVLWGLFIYLHFKLQYIGTFKTPEMK